MGSSSLTRGRTRALHPVSEVSWSWNYQGGSSVLFLKESMNVVPPSLPWETVLVASRSPCPSFFPLLQASEPGRRQFSSQAPPPAPGGLGKGLGSKSVGGYLLGVLPGKGGVSFFFTSPLSCLLGLAKSESNAQNSATI